MKQRILSLLVLLAAAVSGAWAGVPTFQKTIFETTETLSTPISVIEDMEITINENVTVTINGGLTIASGATLTVKGKGTLRVNGANGGAGQAGGTAVSGNIIVMGATVEATGGKGGNGSNGNNASTEWATTYGANGGNGQAGGNGGAAFSGAVTIYRGLIKATGGNAGNGGNGGNAQPGYVGGGDGGSGGKGGNGAVAFAGSLTVYGGNVNASGGNYGSGGSGGDRGGAIWESGLGSYGSGGGSGSNANAFGNNVPVSLQPDLDANDRDAKMYSNSGYTTEIASVSNQRNVYIKANPVFDYKLSIDKTDGNYVNGKIKFTVGEDEDLIDNAHSANEGDLVTMTITPNEGYVVGEVSATPHIQWKARRAISMDIYNNIELTLVSTDFNTGVCTYSFTMPKYDARVFAEYLVVAAFAVEGEKVLVPTAVDGVVAGVDKAIIAEGTVANFPETTNPQGTVQYLVTLDGTMTAEQALQANGWTTVLPTAAGYTDDYAEDFKVYVWYYIKAAEGCADSKLQRIEVTVERNLRILYFDPADKTDLMTITTKVGDAEATTATPDEEGKINPVKMGTQVNLKANTGYKFRKVEVKKGGGGKTVDLSTLTEAELTNGAYILHNGDVLTGTLDGQTKPFQIQIADGATVTLDGATINGYSEWDNNINDNTNKWAGITCLGNATIILQGVNSVKGFESGFPGIYVPGDRTNSANNKTLTIKGNGSLNAQSGGGAAGIGAGYTTTSEDRSCGNIIIQGGNITAKGEWNAAGIGGAITSSCGDITISGGTIAATGDSYAAGIGGGANGTCGTITITEDVTSVTATKGGDASNSIGAGDNGTCGKVTIDSVEDATPSSTFQHFDSNFSGNTWTLTKQ